MHAWQWQQRMLVRTLFYLASSERAYERLLLDKHLTVKWWGIVNLPHSAQLFFQSAYILCLWAYIPLLFHTYTPTEASKKYFYCSYDFCKIWLQRISNYSLLHTEVERDTETKREILLAGYLSRWFQRTKGWDDTRSQGIQSQVSFTAADQGRHKQKLEKEPEPRSNQGILNWDAAISTTRRNKIFTLTFYFTAFF